MDNGKADIIAGIRELRAKAAEQLTGNEYYMIVQQLDSLATSAELSEDAARSVFTLISARLAGAPAISASGGPEVPATPDTPAHPDRPSTPEEPVVPDSPAQPDNSPGPEIPPPPSSPAEPQTPPEVSGATVSAAVEEPAQIITPSANSFGMPQATVAVRFPEPAAPSEAATPETAKPAVGLVAAVMAVRTLAEEKLSGNSYYSAANLLGQLQILPPASGRGEADRPDNFEGALALLRREAAHLSGVAHDEAARVIAALENVLMPKPQPVAEKPAETAAPQSAAPTPEATAEPEATAPVPEAAAEPEATAPEPEPEPRTGFDDLAEAAWERVRHVSAADSRPAGLVNGSTPPATAATAQPAAPAPVAPVAAAPAEMMAQDIGEAFDDGGSESRSSEPCYLHEFEFAAAQSGASEHQEPAAEAGADAASEAQSEAAVPAEAEALTASAEAGAEPLAVAEDANVLTVAVEEVSEPQASGEEEAVPLEAPVAAEAEPRVSELEQAAAVPEQAIPLEELAIATAETAVPKVEPTVEVAEPVVAAAEAVAAETEAAVASSPVIETEAEPAVTAAAASKTEDEAPSPEPAPAAQAAPATQSPKRGFFGRLFGGSSAENRR